MQTLDIDRPDMPDLQFVLLVTALCTSRLTSLNIPDMVRATLFDRCWALVHDGPPPTKLEERVLDLRPWTEVTLEAMVETIRSMLTEAGIRTLTWDHPPSKPTRSSTPEAQPLIVRLEQLYPQPSEVTGTGRGEVLNDDIKSQGFYWAQTHQGGISMDSEDNNVRQLIGEMAALMTAFSPALKRRAAEIEVSGKDSELADKLVKGADVMRDSGNIYLTWARHYAALSEGNPEAAEDADEAEFSV